jgi:hypothetical protein
MTFIVAHEGEHIWVTEATVGVPDYGKRVMSGVYAGGLTFVMTFIPDAEGRTQQIKINITDPDTLDFGRVVRRVSPPKRNDIPCDPQNPLHVTAAGALSRYWVSNAAQDGPTTFCWASLAASMGDPEGEYQKGSLYYHGFGTPKDLQAAFHWVQLSAEHKNLKGITATANMLEQGVGTPRNTEMAATWRWVAVNRQMEETFGLHTEQEQIEFARRLVLDSSDPDPVDRYRCIDGAVVTFPKDRRLPSGYDVCERSGHGGILRP